MTDIVDRLNGSLSAGYSELQKEAAVIITSLRAKLELNLVDPAVQKRLAAQWGYVPAGEQVVPVVKDERAAFREWFEGEQGVAYDGLWSFAKAAWLARAALEESK